jgi:hypothetical protein
VNNGSVTGTLFFNTVPLTIEAFVTACDKFVHPRPCYISHVMVVRLTSSSQMKRCTDKPGSDQNRSMPNLDCMGNGPTFPQPNVCNEFRDCWAVCGRALSWRRLTPLLRRSGPFLQMGSVHKTFITAWTSNGDQFSKRVTILNCQTCAPSAHKPRITWPWTLQPSIVFQQHLKFQWFWRLE